MFGTSSGLVASPGRAGVVSSMRPAFCCTGVRVSSVTGGVGFAAARAAEPLVPEPCAQATPPASGAAKSAMRSKLVHVVASAR